MFLTRSEYDRQGKSLLPTHRFQRCEYIFSWGSSFSGWICHRGHQGTQFFPSLTSYLLIWTAWFNGDRNPNSGRRVDRCGEKNHVPAYGPIKHWKNHWNRFAHWFGQVNIVGLTLPACAMSGLTPDARTMIERARVEAQVSSIFVYC